MWKEYRELRRLSNHFCNNALPQMAQNVLERDSITTETTTRVAKMNRGNLMRLGITIDVG